MTEDIQVWFRHTDGKETFVITMHGEPAVLLANARHHLRERRAGRPPRQLEAYYVDHTVYDAHIPRGAKPLEPQVFRSSMEASAHLGFKFNAVSQAFHVAKARGSNTVIVRGVELRYSDD